MKHKKVLILAVKYEDGEVKAGADALYDRYQTRTDREQEVKLIGLSRSGESTVCTKGAFTPQNGDHIGVYVIAHAHEGNEVVGKLSFLRPLLRYTQPGTITYVCLVICYGANSQKGKTRLSVEQAPMGQLAKHLLGAGMTPTLAGYDALIFLGTEDGERGHKKEIGGVAKLVLRNTRGSRRNQHKFVWTYSDVDNGYTCDKKIGDITAGTPIVGLQQQTAEIEPDEHEDIYLTEALTIVSWQSDGAQGSCPICRRDFGVFLWKHHCRKCGRVVCDDCSKSRRALPPATGVRHPNNNDSAMVRVCDECV